MQNENEIEKIDGQENNQYIETIKKMKETMVDKDEYDKIKAENKQLLDTVINGGDVATETETEKPVDINTLRDELFNKENTNLGYVEKALKLRSELMARGEPDPFLPVGSQITPTDFDIQTAEKVATVLQECVDYAQGDSAIFTNELMRRTQEVKIR